MKNRFRLILWGILLAALILGTILIFQTRPQSATPTPIPADPLTHIADRLSAQGIPVQSVRALQTNPLKVEVVIQKSGDANESITWNIALTERTIELDYLTDGAKIAEYTLNILDKQGKNLGSNTTYLSNGLRASQRVTLARSAAHSDAEVEALIRSNLPFQDLQIKQILVTTDQVDHPNTKWVQIDLTAADLAQANRTISSLIIQLEGIIDQLNQKQNAQIALVRLRVADPDGKLFTEYVYDTDLGSNNWTEDNGFVGDWYPRPMPSHDLEATHAALTLTPRPPTPIPVTATPLPPGYPAPINPYPYPYPGPGK
jgi:hypothetical protein